MQTHPLPHTHTPKKKQNKTKQNQKKKKHARDVKAIHIASPLKNAHITYQVSSHTKKTHCVQRNKP